MAEVDNGDQPRQRRRSSQRPGNLAELKDFGSTLYLRFDIPIPRRGAKRLAERVQETVLQIQADTERFAALTAKLLTGDDGATLADIVEGRNVTPFAKQLGFFVGILLLILGQFLAFQKPTAFGYFYAIGAIALLVQRGILYSRKKQIYFLLDSGYMNTGLLLLNVLFLNRSPTLWKVNFMIANGLQVWGLIILNSSLSFHSMDAISSVFLLYMPALVTYVERHVKGWTVVSGMCTSGAWQCQIWTVEALVFPAMVSLLWIILHTIIVEVLEREKVYSDPDMMTPLKFMVQDRHGNVNRVITHVARSLKILKKREHLDLEKRYATTLTLFICAQFVATVMMLSVSFLCFKSQAFNTLSLIVILSVLIWNGASDYFPEEIKEEITTFVNSFSTRHVPQHYENVSKDRSELEVLPGDDEDDGDKWEGGDDEVDFDY
mmetsp:Transcript_16310/g.18471  ORF Transcript_16310/g.18471 Transcript_16310/m.18471 type:complete len:434 (+) Transcript_16310:232-1533(+)|eukprot:CAMPEP_0184016416 /NCGR_PEP_ID=MMETSP0954-20121128/6918_1 /TAXON_ID=627963 /ORGANISM="Aplanochytrium sp, Strain PBS07" /LENGTH=433 /DNA_ID=CAMNT_0026297437 /DNA_START=202 /DNA_END=1506 /DNA_ORIENTATION=+